MTDSDIGRLRALLDDTMKRGEARLPPEPRLSEALGVSRGRLRTLLKKLEDEGSIWRHVGKGTFVGPRQMIEMPQLSASFSVDDVIQARTLLEPQLAAQAAVHATPEDLALMRACLEEMNRSETMVTWKRLDERLHRLVAQAAHNMLLLLLYDTLRAQISMTLDRRIDQVFGGEAGPKEDTDSQHWTVIDAIERHDPVAAESAMREHLVSLRVKLFGLR